MAADDGPARIDAILAAAPEPQRSTLVRLRATLQRVLPHGVECIKYGIPAVALDGVGVAGYAAFRDHCGYVPFSPGVIEAAAADLAGYTTSKGSIQFPIDRPLPATLVRKLVKLRVAELGAVTDGVRREYFADGRLKAEGRMRDGELHGRWKWFRADGTLLRTGQFRAGEKAGTWTTYDRDGNPTG